MSNKVRELTMVVMSNKVWQRKRKQRTGNRGKVKRKRAKRAKRVVSLHPPPF
jgi:hypothetical protein